MATSYGGTKKKVKRRSKASHRRGHVGFGLPKRKKQ